MVIEMLKKLLFILYINNKNVYWNVKETLFIIHINYMAASEWIKLLRLKRILTLHSVEVWSSPNSPVLFVIVFWGETNRSSLSQMKFLHATLLNSNTGAFLWNLRNF